MKPLVHIWLTIGSMFLLIAMTGDWRTLLVTGSVSLALALFGSLRVAISKL